MDARKGNLRLSFSADYFAKVVMAVLVVAATTGMMLLIGRDPLGEGVIALLYLVPISWSTARWGQGAGIAAAVSAALCFNFFFIPPYYTLYIGSLEGWLLLAIFLMVAIVVVGRIQSGLTRAQAREREAIFMYELSAALAAAPNPQSVARILAEKTQQVFQAELVQVFVELNGRSFIIAAPGQGSPDRKPDLVLPILTGRTLEGEIRLWQGEVRLPFSDDRLLQNFANQGALALERERLVQIHANGEIIV
jgi:K+-sensing histidine kinase KdpD